MKDKNDCQRYYISGKHNLPLAYIDVVLSLWNIVRVYTAKK